MIMWLPPQGVTHLLCERLQFTELTLLVASFKFCKHGFVVRLTSGHQVKENTGVFVSRVFDRLRCTMSSALRAVIVAQVGLAIVKRLSGHAKNLSDAIFGFDLGSPDAASGTETIFGTEVEPGGKCVLG